MWTVKQRFVLASMLLALAVYLAIRAILHRSYISNPPPLDPPLASQMADRIDPNTATWQAWATLPNIGERRAREIVDYREQFVRTHGGRAAFQRPEDLLPIRGIGVATLDNLKPYLLFPQTQPATSGSERVD
jgi:hypothetical protein